MITLWATCPLDALSERREVEDAVVLRLAGMLRENGGPLKSLKAYNGEIDEENADDFMRAIASNSPAILVSTSTGRYDDQVISGRSATITLTVDVVVISASLSGHPARTRGDAAAAESDAVDVGDPGIYYLLAAARRRLMGRQVDIEGGGTLRPVTEQQLYSTDNLTAWRAVYTVPVRVANAVEASLHDGPVLELEHDHELAGTDVQVAIGIATPTP